MKLLPILLLTFALSLGVACASEPASTPVPPIALPTLTFDEEVAQRVREKAIEAAADSQLAAMATAETRATERARIAKRAEARATAAVLTKATAQAEATVSTQATRTAFDAQATATAIAEIEATMTAQTAAAATAIMAQGEVYYDEGRRLFLEREYHAAVKQFEEAITQYTDSIRLNPELASAYYKRGTAKSRLAFCLERDPFSTLDTTSRNVLKQSWIESSVEDYTEAIRIDPDYFEAYMGRANTYYRYSFSTSDWDEPELAIQDYTEAIRIDPDSKLAYSERGRVHHDMGQYRLAIQDYTEAIRIGPNDRSYYYNRARGYREIGYQAAADRDMAKYNELEAMVTAEEKEATAERAAKRVAASAREDANIAAATATAQAKR
jgi:tetratricopeptide (TPR) repeat protein